jgi:indolepyruvate decarboxylase
VERFGAREALAALVAAGSLPVAAMNMGKGVVDETGPTFAGMYVGAASGPAARAAVEEADCLIAAGVLVSDGNTAGFTHAFPRGRTIEVGPARTRIGDRAWELTMPQALDVLTGLVEGRPPAAPPAAPPARAPWRPAPDTTLTQAALWEAVEDFLGPGDVVVAEQGTSFFGLVDRRLPADCRFVGQVLWSSIGYTLPAALGTALADPARRTVLFIGDGSLQLTAQELGTMARTGAAPVVVVVNNGGYSIERAIRPTAASYNDIAPWSYAALLAAFGAPEAFSVRVTTEEELAAALAGAAAEAAAGRMALVEVVVGPEDFPGRLAGVAAKYRR